MASTPPPRLVYKRNGTTEEFDRAKLIQCIFHAIDSTEEVKRVGLVGKLSEAVSQKVRWPAESREIDITLAEIAAQLEIHDLAYGKLATRVQVDNIYKITKPSFSQAMYLLGDKVLSDRFLDLVRRNRRSLDIMVEDDRDLMFSYPALRTLERSYLLKDPSTGAIVERPQYVFVRAALQIHGDDFENVKRTYEMISTFQLMPASPILFNSGKKQPQLSSCFLLSAPTHPDEIFQALTQTSDIGREGGGIGLGLQTVPGRGSVVRGIERAGLPATLKMFDSALPVIEQSVRNRPVALTAYIEPWHPDVLEFVRMKRTTRPEANRTERLFFALFTNDLFMKRVEADGDWTLFCPSQAYNRLARARGEDFEVEYLDMEAAGMGVTTIRAREIWKEITISLIETGGPSILFKDSINVKSNENHLGCITQANLCTEITQYCDQFETAVCNLASIVLPSFVTADGILDHVRLGDAARHGVLLLNEVICQTHPPTQQAERSMTDNCAIGIGIQGLADALSLMGIPFDSPAALEINASIAETIYYSAVDESCNLISTFGCYVNFQGSQASNGWFQFDQWRGTVVSDRYDWAALRTKMKKGMANSLLVAYMPTAGTTQLTGCSECFEPYSRRTRKVLSGEFVTFPRHLLQKLQELQLWSEDMLYSIVAREGSIQHLEIIPAEIRNLYKTVWEINPTVLIRQAAARGPFICQSQSMSLYFAFPSISDVSNALYQAWKAGLKTGVYYLRTKPAAKALPITLPVRYWNANASPDDPICISCSA